MRLVQFFLPGKGKRVGMIRGDQVLDLTSPEEGVRSTLDLVSQGKTPAGLVTRATWLARRLRRRPLEYRALQRAPTRRAPHLLVPIEAPEAWGAAPPVLPEGARPALFFKGTAARSVGPGEPIGLRRDSRLSVPEASLAAILGAGGPVVAFTACNDVTARDLALAHAGFLSQAKVYRGSLALGPCLVTPDELEESSPLQVRCSILRNEESVFSDAVGTAGLPGRLAELAAWLGLDNPCAPGTGIFVPAGIAIPDAWALRGGDRVEVEIQGIGRLGNPVRSGG